MADKTQPEPPAWLTDEFARQLTRVMESMMGESPMVTYAPQESTPAGSEDGANALLWWRQPFTLAPEIQMWVGAARQSWTEIGNRILKSAGVDDGDEESIRSTYLEIVSQALAGVAGALSLRARQEVGCQDGKESPPPAAGGAISYSFDITIGDSALPVIAVLSEALANMPETPAQTEPPKRAEPAAQKSAKADDGKLSPIDLLLDVELPVSVSFGSAQLALKDVIKLTTGSIVELNRAVTEPVDVIVNNCVIARGEVVVVEGNFGIRIRQVISRQERLRTLY